MSKRKEDIVVIDDGGFAVFDDDADLDGDESSDELRDLIRASEERKRLSRHPQKSGKLAPKSWGAGIPL